jgi:hypothetical protein
MTRAAIAAVLAATVLNTAAVAAQQSEDDRAIMQHRLTVDLVKQVVAVDRALVALLKKDPGLVKRIPRDTRGLEASAEQMHQIPELAAILKANRLTPKDYLLTQLAMFSTALTHEFMMSGKLKQLPPNTPTHNLEFWKANAEALRPLDAEWKQLRTELMALTK